MALSRSEIARRYRERHPEWLDRQRARQRANPEKGRAATRRWKENNPDHIRVNREKRQAVRVEALTHYGNGCLQCVWNGCEVIDPDMLTLDHTENNGAAERRESGKKSIGGSTFSYWLKTHGWPTGYQTLCWNHQWKKENERRRNNAND